MVKSDKPRTIWRVLLVGSLALNLALIGGIVGSTFKGRGGDGHPARMSLGVGPLSQALEREDRRAIADEMREKLPPRRRSKEDAAALVAVLTASPFDADAMRTLLQDRTRASAEILTAGQEALINRVAQMTDEQRQAMASRIGRKR